MISRVRFDRRQQNTRQHQTVRQMLADERKSWKSPSQEMPTIYRYTENSTTPNIDTSRDSERRLRDSFPQLYKPCRKSVVANGGYFEG